MSDNKSLQSSRREFLGKSAVAGAALAAAGSGLVLTRMAEARAPDQPVSNKVRWGLLVDAARCVDGCTDCVTACHEENGIEQSGHAETDPQWMRKVELKDERTGYQLSLPMMCQHCETAPCADVCPTGASFIRADGIALVDRHICIGCRYCMMACPYKARSFEHETVTKQKPHAPRGKGTVEACTMCVHRVDSERLPACVEACAAAGHNAIMFGDLKDPNSEIARKMASEPSRAMRADLKLNPGVRYQGV